MELTHWLWTLRQWSRRIWVRIAILSALALATAGLSSRIAPLLPEELGYKIDDQAVSALLSVLSNSMLTVTTFSLSVMVAAHHYASSQATPRSHRLLRADSRTQTVLATFIGAFVYAIVSIVMLNAGVYSDRDHVVVYGVTIVVIAAVIGAIVRWIEHLNGLGSMEKTTERIEHSVEDALRVRLETPCLGGTPLQAQTDIPDGAWSLRADRHGYVQYVNAQGLHDLAVAMKGDVWLQSPPGTWVNPGDALMQVTGWGITPEQEQGLRKDIVMGDTRSYDQDPQFGLQVMSEIAQRALSPGLNDPRTAGDIILRQLRILSAWRDETVDAEAPIYPRLHVPPLVAVDLVNEAFDYIARDGAAFVEVQMRVQAALRALAAHDSPAMREAARLTSRRALGFSDHGLLLAEDRARIHAASPHRRREVGAPTGDVTAA